MRMRIVVAAVCVIAISLTGCSSYFNTKNDAKVESGTSETENLKDLNKIESSTSNSTTAKSLDEIGVDNESNSDAEVAGQLDGQLDAEVSNTEVQETKTIVLEDGTEMIVSVEAAKAISEYESLNAKITESKYPQEKEVRADIESVYETTVESSLSVRSIVYKSTKYSEKAQAVLYADISGVIAGLDGEYEIQLPYEKAIKLKIEDAFAITYQTIRLNERVVITNIKY